MGKSTWRLLIVVRVALEAVSIQYEATTSGSEQYFNNCGKGSTGIGRISGKTIAGCDGRGAELVAVPHRQTENSEESNKCKFISHYLSSGVVGEGDLRAS